MVDGEDHHYCDYLEYHVVSLLAWVVVLITIHSLIELSDLVSDVSGQVQVSLKTVSYCCEQVSCLFKGVVSINDHTTNILTTISREEEGSTISTSELATVVRGAIGITPIKARLGAWDHPLRPKDDLIDILFRALNTCLVDECSSTL